MVGGWTAQTFWIMLLLAGICLGQGNDSGEGRSPLAHDMLIAHNAVRAGVATPPLRWSERLAARAQDWADNLLEHGQFIHRPKSPYGENLLRSKARTLRPLRWWTRGLPNPATTTTDPTNAAAFADITRRSSGAAPGKWDARWLAVKFARFGSATTTPPATSSDSAPGNLRTPRWAPIHQ